MKLRIDKFLGDENIGTRKEISILVRKGFVAVNGVVVKNSSEKIDPEQDKIFFNGKEIQYNKNIYIMMNKPKNLLSATKDKKAKTVLDIIPQEFQRKELFPSGRLDKNTTGLLIITNDGEYAHKMLSPKSHVYKLYKALLDTEITNEDIEKFEKGIQTGGMNFLPAKLWHEEENPKIAYVLIREGKYHQVKRMFYGVGKEVLELERLQIGALSLDKNLKQGECRLLKKEEIDLVFGEFHKNWKVFL